MAADNSKVPSIDTVRPEERQAIVIVPDEKAQSDSNDATTGLAIFGGIVGAFLGGPLGAALGAGLGAAAGSASSDSTSAVRKVGLSDAQEKLAFQSNHPRLHESYGRHPLADRVYIPLADYHRYLRENKHAELTRLLVALGATRVKVRVAQDASTEGKVGAEISVPGFAIRGKASKDESSKHKVLFEETYRPTNAPHVPNGLIWLEREPSWQGLVERRLQYGTGSATARLEYVDDYGVNAELAAKVEQIGGKLSGGFRQIERVIWEFDVTFS